MTTALIRVLVVDDQNLFAESLKIVLEAEARGEVLVVGIAHDGAEAVAMVERLLPDVVLMDVHMAGMDGVEATRHIRDNQPKTKVVMLTTFDDDVYVHDAVKNGAVGYILKTVELPELVAAIRAVHAGSFLVSPSVGERLALGTYQQRADSPQQRVRAICDAFPQLTSREADVVILLVDAFDNYEIAEKLHLAEQTVKNYISTIYAKLGVKDRSHAVRLVQSRSGGPE